MPALRFLAGALALMVVVAGCASGDKRGARPGSTSQVVAEGTEPQTNVQKLAAQTDDFGYITKDASLQLFALLYGPVPGVTPPPGGTGALVDGSIAIDGVFRAWPELSDAQRDAIRRALGRDASYVPPSGTFGKSRQAGPTIAPASTFAPDLDKVKSLLAAHLGALPVSVELSTVATGPPDIGADAGVYDGPKGNACYVRLYPAGATDPSTLYVVLAHELTHCYQDTWGKVAPAWIEEGMAMWTGVTINAEAGKAPSGLGQGWIEKYANTPQTSLLARSYDALGWFAFAAQSGVDLWPRLKSIQTASYGRAAYDAATYGADGTFVEGWGPAQFDSSEWAGRWQIAGPGITPLKATITSKYKAVKNGDKVVLSAGNFASARKPMVFTADVVLIAAGGLTEGLDRIDGTTDRPLKSFDGFQCTSPKGCECPAGTARAGEKFPALNQGPHFFAISGGPEPSQLTVSGFSLDDACNAKSCVIGTWTNSKPPQVKNITNLRGGTGSVLTIEPDGAVTLDYGATAPFEGDTESGQFTLRVGGVITAKITVPPGTEVDAAVPFTNAKLSGATGSGTLYVGGFGVPIDEGFVSGFLSLGDGGSGVNIASCANDSLTISTGSGTWTYERVK